MLNIISYIFWGFIGFTITVAVLRLIHLLFIMREFKGCKKCLVEPACSQVCEKYKDWYHKRVIRIYKVLKYPL